MPQVICRHHRNVVLIFTFGENIRQLVAQATTTEEHPVTVGDVDWILQQDGMGSICSGFALEIRLIGFQDRKKKLGEADVLKLKEQIGLLPNFPTDVNRTDPFIWIQFSDPDDVYV